VQTPDLLTPEGGAKLSAARIVLRETEGFLYLPLLAQSQAAASAALTYLLSDWQGPAPFQIAWPVPPAAHPQTEEEREALRGQLLENLDHAIALQAKGAILVLDASPNERYPLALDTVSYLNQRRETLRQRQLRLILLWPFAHAQELMAGAPDLWSMRSLAPVIGREDVQPYDGNWALQTIEPSAASQGTGLSPLRQEQWQRWLAHRDLAAARLSVADALALVEALHGQRAWPEIVDLSEGVLHELQAPKDDALWADRASALNWLSVARSEQGDRRGSLAPVREAVKIRRRLAQGNPSAFEPNFAASLNNLAKFLADAGETNETFVLVGEAVEIFRRLAQNNPGAYEPYLAGTLNNMTKSFNAIGERDRALASAREAVEIYRRLSEANPDAFEPDLAGSLNNLAACFSAMGERGAALATARQAVDIYRSLAQATPAAFEVDLAMSLNNLAILLSNASEQDEMLAVALEAVVIYRRQAQAHPAAFEPDLAKSLAVLAQANLKTGAKAEAKVAAAEALGLIEPWAERMPAVFKGLRDWIQSVKDQADAAPS
jgi:tetratricopeptide (TPR) repeat protein